jgi:hypothetical protein
VGNINPKVPAAGGGAALGSALVGIFLYYTHQSPPPDVVASLCLVVSSVLAIVSGYLTPGPH